MGLLDSVKDLFSKKDIMEKIKKYGEDENTGKLVRLVSAGNPTEVRIAAIDALKEIKMDELCVNTLMNLLDDNVKEVVLAACNSLKKVGTKREVDRLFHRSEQAEDEDIKKALSDAAVAAKERTPRF